MTAGGHLHDKKYGGLQFPPTFAPVLKYPVTILLILLIALQTFSKWALILEYQVNKDFIAKNLCVNRNNIISCCAGKCYLNKKLAKDESQQQAPGRSAQKEESPLQLFSQTGTSFACQAPIARDLHSTRWLPSKTEQYIHSFFQPPQLSILRKL